MVFSGLFERVSGLFRSKEDLDLVCGPVGENLYYLALPIVIINLLQTAYNIADTFWLGQYSKEALAAITFAFPLVFFLISLGMGLSVAGNVLVSQFEGSGQFGRRDFAASQAITFSFFVSIFIGLFGYFFMPFIINLLGAEGVVAVSAISYMRVISMGIFFMFGFAVFMSLMRGYGDVVTPMVIMFATVVVNIILDPILINGWLWFPEMGVRGAAIATIFSRALALITGLYVLFTGKRGIQIHWSRMRPDFDIFKKMVDIGVPATAGGAGRAVSVNLIVAVVGNVFSNTVVSGYGIGVRLFSLIFLPAIAGGWAVSTMTGQNLGAEKPHRAEKAANLAAKYMFIILSALGVISFIFAGQIAAIFSKNPDVIRVATQFLRWVSLTFGFMGVLKSYTGSLRGAGNTIEAAIISVSVLGLIRLPIAYFGSINIGQLGLWISFGISNILGALLGWGYYQRGTWKEAVITKEKRDKGMVAEECDEYESTISD